MEGIPTYLTPGLGNRFGDWLRILRWRRHPLSPAYYHRVAIVGGICLLSTPFQLYESVRLRKKLALTTIRPDPVFIIGHWRSGTTFLHNLMSLDTQFGYVHTVQSLFPHSFLTNPLFPWLTQVLMPSTRPMDDMRLYLRSPQEEEMALVNYGPWSFYHGWHFPRSLRQYFREMVLMQGISPAEAKSWQDAYRDLLRKTTLHAGGRRLLLKNPAHTARIPALRKMFPEARFIFLHRDPLEVFPSTRKMYHNVVPVFQLQEFDKERMDEDIIWIYRELLGTYLRDRSSLPPNRLAEVSFSELSTQPLSVLERLYHQLELGPFTDVETPFREYLDKKLVREYRPGQYRLDGALRERLEREWSFAWENWPEN